MSAKPLIALLAEHSGRDLADDAEVAAALARVMARARADWPQLALDEATFIQHLASHLPEATSCVEALDKLHAGDLYLACACARGEREAVAGFEREYLSRVPAVIARIERVPANVDEIVQSVRVSVLTGAPPRIVQYSGRGPLHGWLRAVALNAALMAQRRRREVLQSTGTLTKKAVAERLDPEMQLVRERHRAHFQAALDAALQSLTVRERNLLRAHLADEMTIDELGVLFRVHRATAARWLQAAFTRLLDETRQRVMEKVQLTSSEFDSLAALVRSELSLSWSGLKR